MKNVVWMSGEIQDDVYENYRVARNEMEVILNTSLRGALYGQSFSRLCLIPMLFDSSGPDYKEIRRYDKRDKVFEFRLRIPHAEFKAADALGQRRLIMENILRAVDEMKDMRVKDVEVDKLERAIRDVAAAHDWLPASRSN